MLFPSACPPHLLLIVILVILLDILWDPGVGHHADARQLVWAATGTKIREANKQQQERARENDNWDRGVTGAPWDS